MTMVPQTKLAGNWPPHISESAMLLGILTCDHVQASQQTCEDHTHLIG